MLIGSFTFITMTICINIFLFVIKCDVSLRLQCNNIVHNYRTIDLTTNVIYLCLFFATYRNNETLIHLLKGSLGTGILAMPNAFYNSGLLIGTVGTILIGILCTYCLHVLVSIVRTVIC